MIVQSKEELPGTYKKSHVPERVDVTFDRMLCILFVE